MEKYLRTYYYFIYLLYLPESIVMTAPNSSELGNIQNKYLETDTVSIQYVHVYEALDDLILRKQPTSPLYGFFLVCTRLWDFRLLNVAKAAPHWSQL